MEDSFEVTRFFIVYEYIEVFHSVHFFYKLCPKYTNTIHVHNKTHVLSPFSYMFRRLMRHLL